MVWSTVNPAHVSGQDLLGYRLDEAVDRAAAAGILPSPNGPTTRLRVWQPPSSPPPPGL